MGYQYDPDSNLISKTDARVPAVVTSYQYDALNRVTSRTYTGGTVATPAVTYAYETRRETGRK